MKFIFSTLILFSLPAFAFEQKIASYAYEDLVFQSECAVYKADEGLRITHWVSYSGKEEIQEINIRDMYNFVELHKEIINSEYTSEQTVATYQTQYTAFGEGTLTPIYGRGIVNYQSKSPKADEFVKSIDAMCSLFVAN